MIELNYARALPSKGTAAQGASVGSVGGPGSALPRPRYRPDIEGLRAVAVLIVVLFHAQVPGFSGGFVGVDVFFVLSGYLITWLLVYEAEQTGTIRFARFYARRARRLLPAIAAVLILTIPLTALLYAPFEQRTLARTWIATALYVSNIDFAHRTLDYHGADAQTNPLLHTWSLSVEEQFYLVWPWLVYFGLIVSHRLAPRSSSREGRLLAVLGITTVLSFIFSLELTSREAGWAFYLSPARAWEFGAGGMAVLVPTGRWPRRRLNPAQPDRLNSALSWVGIAGLVVAATFFDDGTPFPGVAALVPVASTILILRAGSPESSDQRGVLIRLLSTRPLQFIGKLSYSWYLWHWPALVFAAALTYSLGPFTRASAVLGSLVLAYLSFRFVEDPLRHHRALALRPARSFAMAAAMGALTVMLAALWWNASVAWSTSGTQSDLTRVRSELPAIYADYCDHFGRADLIECAYGDSSASRTAVLIGDSHAGQWFSAVRAAADSAGWRLIVMTLSACPMLELPPLYNATLGRIYHECPQWRASALDALRKLSPDITFVGSSSDYDVPVDTWGAQTRPVLSVVSQHSQRTVLIVDTPPAGIDVPACLARAAWRPGELLDPDCKPRGKLDELERADAQARVAAMMPRVEVLDLREEVCEVGVCEATRDGIVRYRDGGHLASAFALTFRARFFAYLSENEDP